METAIGRFQRLLLENNLTAKLGQFTFNTIDDGSIIIKAPSLIVAFIDPAREKPDEKQPNKEQDGQK